MDIALAKASSPCSPQKHRNEHRRPPSRSIGTRSTPPIPPTLACGHTIEPALTFLYGDFDPTTNQSRSICAHCAEQRAESRLEMDILAMDHLRRCCWRLEFLVGELKFDFGGREKSIVKELKELELGISREEVGKRAEFKEPRNIGRRRKKAAFLGRRLRSDYS